MSLRKKSFQIAKKLVLRRNLLSYNLRGRRPWTRGYFEYKWNLIKNTLGNSHLMATFRDGGLLPHKFGHRIDERIVEFPWLLSQLPEGPAELLDAGSALNFEVLLTQPKLAEKKITIVTLNPEAGCFWYRGISYLYKDLRKLPFVLDYFDLVTCISTLEHVGMNNTIIYTADKKYKENKTEDYLLAATELMRVLKPGGSLFLTVPFGKKYNYNFFQQFDQKMVDELKNTVKPAKFEEVYYQYVNGGWQASSRQECALAEYVTADKAKKSLTLPAAAVAVACIKITK